MKPKTSQFLIIGLVLLTILAVSFYWMAPVVRVMAAPRPAPLAQASLPAMTALPELACVDDGTLPGTRTCDLWIMPGSITLPNGQSVTVWGFAGSELGPAVVPGPVIRATEGQTLVINLHNALDGQAVSLAFPGINGIPDMTGAVTGGTVTYTLPNLTAGTFIYEAGMTEGGARQVAMGVSGPLLVNSASQPAWDQEVILFLNEVDPSFHADPVAYSMIRYKAKYWLINGKAYPQTGYIPTTAGSTIWMRYLNASVDFHSIGLLGLNQEVIAADGEPVPLAYGATVPSLAPGQTLETLVRIPAEVVDGALYPLYQGTLLQHNNNQRLADTRVAFGGMLSFLQVTGGSTPGGKGPVASNVSVNPAKSNGQFDLTLSATLTDDNTTVTAAEYFIDAIGTNNSGQPVTVSAPAQSIEVVTTIPVADLALLASGNHTIYIHGMDADGNWGAPGSAVITLDKTGPVISGAAAVPNPTNGTVDVLIGATADDSGTGSSNVVEGQYRIDGGTWTAMTVNPPDAPVAGLSATIPAATMAALPEGGRLVEVQAMDDLGNWSQVPASLTLNLDMTGPTVLTATLTPNSIDLSQPLPTTVRLNATLEDLISPLTNAEAFIDTVGAPGSGIALYPSDGLFDELNESVYYNIPGSRFSTLTAGTHYVLVMGKDKAGNWGQAGSAPIEIIAQTIDLTPPTVSNLAASPNPTAGAQNVTLTATASDTQSNITRVVWFQGTNPARAKLYNMTATDGAFDSRTENVTATISVRKWKPGTYQISARALDAAGNWSAIVTITLVVN